MAAGAAATGAAATAAGAATATGGAATGALAIGLATALEPALGVAGRAIAGGAAATTGRGGAAATTGREAAAWRSASRSWIARSTSPGFDTFDRSMLGRFSGSRREVCPPPLFPPRRTAARTRSASSASSELECVFFSVTPATVSTSRIALLFTSSSRAKSLIRTLLIRPFVFHQNRLHAH